MRLTRAFERRSTGAMSIGVSFAVGTAVWTLIAAGDVAAAPFAYTTIAGFFGSPESTQPDRVVVMDLATNAVVGTIPISELDPSDGLYVWNDARGVAIAPDGNHVYVVGRARGSGPVRVVDTNANALARTAAGGEPLQRVRFSPNGCIVYLLSDYAIYALDRASDGLIGSVELGGPSPKNMVVSPDGGKIYLIDPSGDDSANLLVVDAATLTLQGSPIPLPETDGRSEIYRMAMSPSGTRVYIANRRGNGFLVVDTSTLQAVFKPVPCPSFTDCSGEAIAFAPSGNRAYVADDHETLSVIENDELTGSSVTLGSSAQDVAVSPDGSRVFALRFDGFIDVVDTASMTVVETIDVDGDPNTRGVPEETEVVIGSPGGQQPQCQAPPTTTTTTLPNVSSCATARDCLRALQGLSLCAEAVNPKLQKFIGKRLTVAVGALDKAAASSKPPKAAKLVGKARKQLDSIDRKAGKFTKVKKGPISAACQAAIGGALAPARQKMDVGAI